MLKKVIKSIRTGVLFAIKWRYLIALIVFIFCVAFKLHGSSITEYNNLFSGAENYNEKSIILGESRPIRSDEWLVHTPYYMSQAYNNFEKDSHMMSLEGQDMIVGYNAPVLDITILGKPFTWGYILLGNDYGLSWYWCMKLILLILVSFELCMIITKGNKKVSLLGMLLISFAPAVQWWFIPHMVDVFFWGMAVLVLAYHLFATTGWKRNLMTVLLPLSMVTFAIALFPSLQIPVALLDVALLVAFLVRDKKEITFKKREIWRIVIIAIYVLGVLGLTIISSKDAISALYNTSYPGKRVSTGGDLGLRALFTDPVTFTLPFKDITFSNNSEISDFIHFAPLLFMLYPIIYKKLKRDKNILVGNVMLGCIIIMAVFMLAGFPSRLAKLTFFSYINRMHIVYAFTATLFIIWGISMIWKKKIFSIRQISIALFVYALLYICFINADDLTYLSWIQYGGIIVGLTILGYLMLGGCQKLFILSMTVLMAVSGMTINPLASGTVPITKHPLAEKIREISDQDSDAYWLAVNNNLLASLMVANGAKTLNMVNFYPDSEKWEILDPSGEYQEAYNRYAHIITEMTDKETAILPGETPDSLKLKLSFSDLDDLSIKYLVTAGELEGGENVVEKIYTDKEGDYYIYERVSE